MVAPPPSQTVPHSLDARPVAAPISSVPPSVWQDLLDRLACGIAAYDASDRLTIFNAHFRELYGPMADAIIPGRSFEELLRVAVARGLIPQAADDPEAWIAERVQEHQQPQGPQLRRMADGSWRNIIESRLSAGGLVSFSVDVTELRNQRASAEAATRQAEAANQRLQDAIEALPDGFALFDAADRLVTCNERYRSLYPESTPAMHIGARFEDILRFGLARGQYPQALGQEEQWLAARLHRHRQPGEPQLQELPGNRWLRIDERVTSDGGVAGIRSDVTELIRREQELQALNEELAQARAQLEQLSETDGLTGVANRRQFDRRLIEEWSRHCRHETPLTLAMVDIDHFKRYNDHYGHPAGDDCLRQVAQLISSCARRPTDIVARYGGEEFVILMPHTGADAAVMQAMRFVAAISEAGIAHANSPVAPHVSLSVGVIHTEGRELESAEAMLQAADRALYRAKAAGRNRAEIG